MPASTKRSVEKAELTPNQKITRFIYRFFKPDDPTGPSHTGPQGTEPYGWVRVNSNLIAELEGHRAEKHRDDGEGVYNDGAVFDMVHEALERHCARLRRENVRAWKALELSEQQEAAKKAQQETTERESEQAEIDQVVRGMLEGIGEAGTEDGRDEPCD